MTRTGMVGVCRCMGPRSRPFLRQRVDVLVCGCGASIHNATDANKALCMHLCRSTASAGLHANLPCAPHTGATLVRAPLQQGCAIVLTRMHCQDDHAHRLRCIRALPMPCGDGCLHVAPLVLELSASSLAAHGRHHLICDGMPQLPCWHHHLLPCLLDSCETTYMECTSSQSRALASGDHEL